MNAEPGLYDMCPGCDATGGPDIEALSDGYIASCRLCGAAGHRADTREGALQEWRRAQERSAAREQARRERSRT